MKKNKIFTYKVVQFLTVFSLIALPLAAAVATPSLVSAQPKPAPKKCGGVDTAIFTCPSDFDGKGGVERSGVMGILHVAINVLAVSVGILAVGALVFAGVLYAAAADNEEQVKKAKDIIRNTIIGLVLFAGMYMLIQFLIPGGVQ